MSGSERWLLDAPRSFSLQAIPGAPLEPGWVRLRFLFCGICGSDVSTYEGRRPITYPRSLGHEFIAEVMEASPGVEHLARGDLVSSDLNHRCGTCDQCRVGRSHLCRNDKVQHFSNRAFAHAGDIRADYLTRLKGPAGPQLALSEPLSCVLHALDWARVMPDDDVLVIGAGGLGMCMALALSAARPGVAFAVEDTNPERLARVLAACACARPAAPGHEYSTVFDLSGSESGLRAGTERVMRGGRLCTMSHLDGYSSAAFLLAALTRRDVTFTVSYLNGERESLARAARLIDEHWTPAWDAAIEIVPFADLSAAFAGRRASPACKTVVRI